MKQRPRAIPTIPLFLLLLPLQRSPKCFISRTAPRTGNSHRITMNPLQFCDLNKETTQQLRCIGANNNRIRPIIQVFETRREFRWMYGEKRAVTSEE